jgi:hypothetical protein
MTIASSRDDNARSGMIAVPAIAASLLVFHCIFNDRYNYFRDEFDYLACGQHLAWGYVDQPPLLPFLVRVSREVLGDSLRSIRFLPALATSLALVLSALTTRELGGRRFALILCSVAFVISPLYLSDGSLLVTNSLEPLFWMGCVYAAVLAIRREPRYWLLFGVSAGLGLEEKYSIAILGFAIVVGLVLTRHRRMLINKWFIAGGIVAFLIFLPNLIWNVYHDWPFLELMHNIRASGRDVQLSPLDFFLQQLLLIGPFTAPIWLTGLVALLFFRRFENYRILGWAYLVAFIAFVVLNGKNYYLGPIYPMLFAAGAIVFESGIERMRQLWLKPVAVAILVLGGAVLAPIVVPILPVEDLTAYLDKLPFKIPRSEHSHESAALPQHYADQFGWEEMVAMTANAWQRIPADERPDCGIFAQDYGQAGAIDFFGPRYGLPPALSGHQTYYLWGPRGYSGNCMIVLDDKKEKLDQLWESVEYVGSSDNEYALERDIPVYICKGAKFGTLADIWQKVKRWN